VLIKLREESFKATSGVVQLLGKSGDRTCVQLQRLPGVVFDSDVF
jgi:hypothetical protein